LTGLEKEKQRVVLCEDSLLNPTHSNAKWGVGGVQWRHYALIRRSCKAQTDLVMGNTN
jgi:hypothetical protein